MIFSDFDNLDKVSTKISTGIAGSILNFFSYLQESQISTSDDLPCLALHIHNKGTRFENVSIWI